MTEGPRTFRLACSLLAPALVVPQRRAAQTAVLDLKAILLAAHADAVLEHLDVPWGPLLAGVPPGLAAAVLFGPAALRARALGLRVFVALEPANPLDRSTEASILLQAGRSLGEAAVQSLYRDYAVAVATVIQPDALGIAPEVNAMRCANPSLYAAMQSAAALAASALHTAAPSVTSYVTFNAETAWGLSGGSTVLGGAGSYVGIEHELADFGGFVQAIGFSMYPSQLFGAPEQVPADYLTRPLGGRSLPVLIDESGWPSSYGPGETGSDNPQVRWTTLAGTLADSVSARLLGQLEFVDAETCWWTGTASGFLDSQGLLDINFRPKPALAAWDRIERRVYSAPG